MTIITMYLNLKPPLSAPCKQRFSGAAHCLNTNLMWSTYLVIKYHPSKLSSPHQSISPHTQSYKSEINLTDRGGAWQWNNLNAVCYVLCSLCLLPSPSPRINYYQQWWRASLATGRCDTSQQSLSPLCFTTGWLAGCLLFMSSELGDQTRLQYKDKRALRYTYTTLSTSCL